MNSQQEQEEKEAKYFRLKKIGNIFTFFQFSIVALISLPLILDQFGIGFMFFGFIIPFFEILLIFPLCLLMLNRKKYGKKTFIVFFTLVVACSTFLTYFCYKINQFGSLASLGFWIILCFYLPLSIIILEKGLRGEKYFTFNLFKDKLAIIMFVLYSISYLFYCSYLPEPISYYKNKKFIDNELRINPESVHEVDYCYEVDKEKHLNYYESGKVNVGRNMDQESFSDYCIDENTLMKQWCLENFNKYYYGEKEYKCEGLCHENKCVP